VVRLIKKWLHAGVLEDGRLTQSEIGTVQGGSISPLLSNIYLHYAFDLWVKQWRARHAEGDMIVVRYADDWVAGFQYVRDAERFQREVTERQDAADRVRALCARELPTSRQTQTAYLRLPGLYALLREDSQG
jgi:retron-type reverse transcriptase